MKNAPESLPLGVLGDRRGAARVSLELECEAVTEDDFFLLSSRISDLSSTGLRLRADGIPADVGEEVIISFRPPRSTVWIDARAKIVRLLTGTEEGAPGFGLALESLSPFEREVLASAIARSLPKRTALPSEKRRRVHFGRRRFVDSEAVAVKPLLRVDAGETTVLPALTATRLVLDVPTPPRGLFQMDPPLESPRFHGDGELRSLWRLAPDAAAGTDEVAPKLRSRRSSRRRNPKLRFPESQPRRALTASARQTTVGVPTPHKPIRAPQGGWSPTAASPAEPSVRAERMVVVDGLTDTR